MCDKEGGREEVVLNKQERKGKQRDDRREGWGGEVVFNKERKGKQRERVCVFE
jgi:hypothetical protein